MAHEDNIYGFHPADSTTRPMWLPVAASQTLARGDAVYLSTGTVMIAIAGNATLCGAMAAPSVSADANTLVPVFADPATIFYGMMDADSSSVVANTEADLIGTTGAMMIDADASTVDHFKMIRADPDDTTTSAYAKWLFTINKHDRAQID
ncbi:MAG: hypothetical protein GY835_24005 [bacterium]|nr:hypothetical protein [bacterium]